jgi:hypothetical protein
MIPRLFAFLVLARGSETERLADGVGAKLLLPECLPLRMSGCGRSGALEYQHCVSVYCGAWGHSLFGGYSLVGADSGLLCWESRSRRSGLLRREEGRTSNLAWVGTLRGSGVVAISLGQIVGTFLLVILSTACLPDYVSHAVVTPLEWGGRRVRLT